MRTAIMILAFNCYEAYFLIHKQQSLRLSKKQKFPKKSTKNLTLCRTKLSVKNTKF